jgi:hypothetical protein
MLFAAVLLIAHGARGDAPGSRPPLAIADLAFGDQRAVAEAKLARINAGNGLAPRGTVTIGDLRFEVALSFCSKGLWRVDLLGPEADWSEGSEVGRLERILTARYGTATQEDYLKAPTGFLIRNEAFNPVAVARSHECEATSAWLTEEREVTLWACERAEPKSTTERLADDARRLLSEDKSSECPDPRVPDCTDFDYLWRAEISIVSPQLSEVAMREEEEGERQQLRDESGPLP